MKKKKCKILTHYKESNQEIENLLPVSKNLNFKSYSKSHKKYFRSHSRFTFPLFSAKKPVKFLRISTPSQFCLFGTYRKIFMHGILSTPCLPLTPSTKLKGYYMHQRCNYGLQSEALHKGVCTITSRTPVHTRTKKVFSFSASNIEDVKTTHICLNKVDRLCKKVGKESFLSTPPIYRVSFLPTQMNPYRAISVGNTRGLNIEKLNLESKERTKYPQFGFTGYSWQSIDYVNNKSINKVDNSMNYVHNKSLVPLLFESDLITFLTQSNNFLPLTWIEDATNTPRGKGYTKFRSTDNSINLIPLQGKKRFDNKSIDSLLTPIHASKMQLRGKGGMHNNPFEFRGTSNAKVFPGQLIAYGTTIAKNTVTTESGQVLYIDSQKTIIRKAQTVLIYSQAIIAVLAGEWIKKGTPLMSLSYQKLVTGDIVQGLPKIEQFFEAPVLKDGTFWSDSLQAKLNQYFQEQREILPLAEAVRKGFSEIQRVLVEGVQRVYISQGVLIADKHLEVIVRQMTCKGRILYSGDTGFLRNELVSLDKIENVNQVTYGQKALYHPQVRGITDASLESESFLSAASFQETTRVLSRDAIIGKTDLMRGLKERVIVGELIQAGTGLATNSVYNFL